MNNGPANRLIHATSPYLQQHAHNPVDWFEWTSEALDKALREDKPILVSIGYSSCHWCHVMERESFEADEVAAIMNSNFVCIKVDREERPDIDHVYMEAVQAMGVNGGWPLNVFLTPDQQPFYGGTYFPKRNWVSVLQQIRDAFRQKRNDINASANDLTRHLNISDLGRFRQDPATATFDAPDLDNMFQVLASRFDHEFGGLENVPKFVMPSVWTFLLNYHSVSTNTDALKMVVLTLTRMSEGGLFDQLGGGFSRYSVDREWFAPHFEKMLYDNAQLISLYSEASAYAPAPLFREIAYATAGWLEREMTHAEGGFYSALDADSEGDEGKFYTWTFDEIHTILGDRAQDFSQHFSITPIGNWEHGQNILRRSQDSAIGLPEERMKLLRHRETRPRPSLDDKILAGWNAMAVTGLAKAYGRFNERKFLDAAKECIKFIERNLIQNGRLYRSFRNQSSATEGFLEDHAFVIQAYVALYQVTFDEGYLHEALRWCTHTLNNFFDSEEGFFHFSGKQAESLIAQKKEIFDNVIPSSNSVMARNLFHLGILLDNTTWVDKARTMVAQLQKTIRSEPGYLSHWGILLTEMIHGMAEVVIVGPDAERFRAELAGHPLPFVLLMGTTTTSDLPLFEGRNLSDGRTRIYVCHNKACKLPVETVGDALRQLV